MRSIPWLLPCVLAFSIGTIPAKAQQSGSSRNGIDSTRNTDTLAKSPDSAGGPARIITRISGGTDSGFSVKDHSARGRHSNVAASKKAAKTTVKVVASVDSSVKKRDTAIVKPGGPVVPGGLVVRDSPRTVLRAIVQQGSQEGNKVLPEKENGFLKPVLWVMGFVVCFLLFIRVVPAPVLWRAVCVIKGTGGVQQMGTVQPRAPGPNQVVPLPIAESGDVIAETGVEEPFFVCEIMMTAGPRKKFMNEWEADKDLGEDVCGCVINNDKAGVWLLDGTSDQHCFRHPLTGEEYFSSRLLAQHIGDNLRKAFTMKNGGGPLDEMMDKAIDDVRKDWVRVCNDLPAQEKLLLCENILDKNFPECSSTLLTARLALSGQLEAYRSGDSKMIFFRGDQTGLIPVEASFTTKNPESNDRIFFRLIANTEGRLDILYNKPAHELTRQENIHTLIGFSDGIGAFTEEALREEYKEDPDSVRRRIIAHSQGTADDKSICFVRIK